GPAHHRKTRIGHKPADQTPREGGAGFTSPRQIAAEPLGEVLRLRAPDSDVVADQRARAAQQDGQPRRAGPRQAEQHEGRGGLARVRVLAAKFDRLRLNRAQSHQCTVWPIATAGGGAGAVVGTNPSASLMWAISLSWLPRLHKFAPG